MQYPIFAIYMLSVADRFAEVGCVDHGDKLRWTLRAGD